MAKTIQVSAHFDKSSLTPYAKRLIGLAMYRRGKNFIAAGILLEQKGGDQYAVLHLLCQGCEIALKGILLILDYEKFEPKLRDYGHDLVRLARDVNKAFSTKPTSTSVMSELSALNNFYRQHLLRYAGAQDIFIDPASIKRGKVMRRIAAVTRLAERVLSKVTKDEHTAV
jgi:hypothetical protein